jgi:RND family efflux transporter MFP subunit
LTRPRVEIILPKLTASDRAILLPGSAQPLEETSIYARANGYVSKWFVDLGDTVKQGQLLAEIDTPELDQELEQARAQLAQSQAVLVQTKANRNLSATSLRRYERLTPAGVASQQELDQRQAQAQVDEANVDVAQAAVRAQEANIRRLGRLKSFARLIAPFDGKVTMRSIERGALVSAGNGTAFYTIAAIDPTRVFVQVPQDVAPAVRTNMPAKVSVREYPGRTFDGKVSGAAGELNAATRTMTTVISVPNPKGELLPGMYVQVALTLPSSHRVLEIPATALLSDAHGTRVAIVDAEEKIRLLDVVVERDTGATIEISSGLVPDARVVKIASVELADGALVEVAR